MMWQAALVQWILWTWFSPMLVNNSARIPHKENFNKVTGTLRARGSPWISHPRPSNKSMHCNSWKQTTRYAPRMFLGGAKAGSTGLWQMLLTGQPITGAGHNSSDFIGLAQEFSNRRHERNLVRKCVLVAENIHSLSSTGKAYLSPRQTSAILVWIVVLKVQNSIGCVTCGACFLVKSSF